MVPSIRNQVENGFPYKTKHGVFYVGYSRILDYGLIWRQNLLRMDGVQLPPPVRRTTCLSKVEQQKCVRCKTLFNPFKHYNEETRNCVALIANEQNVLEQKSFDKHVYNNNVARLNGPFYDFIEAPIRHEHIEDITIYALDCEMLYTELGLEVGRVTVVDLDLQTVLDAYVQPIGKIICYNEKFSSLRPECFIGARTFEEVRSSFLDIVERDDFLVGHGLHCDLIAMRVVHKWVIDTSLLIDYEDGKRKGLKKLCQKYLASTIQEGNHSSEVDAKASLSLFVACYESLQPSS